MSPAARRRLIWAAPAILVALIILAGGYYAVALPGCASCHGKGEFAEQTQASAHAAVECRSCHVPTAALDRVGFGFRQLFHMVLPLDRGTDRDAAAVPDARCVVCHDKLDTKTSTSNGLRIRHSSCAEGSSCSACHSATAHGTATTWLRVYDMDTCLECHVSQSSVKCDLCHEGRATERRIKSGTFAVTHGPDWQKTHGMGNAATCTVCHTAATCDKCHGPGLPHDAKFIEKHAEFAVQPDAKCSGCHERSFCNDCHGTEMPHPAGFTKTHEKTSDADPAACKRCHSDDDCKTCHEMHVHPGGAIGTLGNTSTGGGE